MTHYTARQIVEKFCDELNRALHGENVNPFLNFHPDTVFRHPDLGVMKGVDAITERVGAAIAETWKVAPYCGFYPIEFIEEEDHCAVVCMSHSEGCKTGDPYNNTYYFFMKVENGKVTSCHESLDSSIVERVGFDKHLEGTVMG